MDAAEQALFLALEASPEDWAIRLLLAEKLHQRGAFEEAEKLIGDSPNPPDNPQQLERAATIGGDGALPQAQAYVAANPADGYGHQLLGHLYEEIGNDDQANKHLEVAAALGAVSRSSEEIEEAPAYASIPQKADHHQRQSHPSEKGGANRFQPPQVAEIVQEEEEARPSRKAGSKLTAILVAIGVHLLIGLIAAILVILPPAKDEPKIVAAVIGPPIAKQEMQKKNVVKQVKKSSSPSSASAPIAQLMRASAMAKFSLPEVKKTSTGPLGMGEGNVGSGGFGGTGSGLGSGASFFGGTAKGQRFLFVLDHSASMKTNQIELRNKELERALDSLKGVQYHVLLFAGAAYYAQEGWSIKGLETVTDDKGKTYQFKKKAVSDFDIVGGDSKLPKTKWLDATPANKKATMDFIRKTPKFGGTDWEMALRVAHHMEPPPDVIFFMADGTGGNAPQPILDVNKKQGAPVINTIAMQTSRGAREFAAVARGTKGKFTIVDKKGKPIDGFEFLKDPGKFKGRL